MVIFTFNKKRGVKIAIICAMAVSVLMFCALIALERREAVRSYAVDKKIGRYSTEAPDERAQAEFLMRFGINIDTKTKKKDKVIIPSDFSETYQAYNKLQKAVGLDLEPFGGEQADRVVYKLKDSKKYVTLLLFKARVIGGHLSTGVFGDGYEDLNGKAG